MNKYLKEILKEMFRRAGEKYPKDEKYFKKENWFWSKTWTEKEQDDFREWLIDYIKDNKEARQKLMNIPSAHKRALEKLADDFLLNYGWKLK